MPVVYLKRVSQKGPANGPKYATYEEDTREEPLIGVLVLRSWTTVTPPFPQRLRLEITGEDW